MKFGKKAMDLIDNHIESEFPDTNLGQLPSISLWQFYNGANWYISHHAVSLNHRVALEGRLRDVIIVF